MLPRMDEQRTVTRPHPAAIGGAALAAVALLMAATGFVWAWTLGLAAVVVAASAHAPGVWTRVLALFGVIGGMVAVGVSLM